MDDQPVFMRTRNGGRILAVPYPQELNDIPAIVRRNVGGSQFADMIVDMFDEMLEQSAGGPLVMGIALHAYIVGQPFRLRHLRRALNHIAAHRGTSVDHNCRRDRVTLHCAPCRYRAGWRNSLPLWGGLREGLPAPLYAPNPFSQREGERAVAR